MKPRRSKARIPKTKRASPKTPRRKSGAPKCANHPRRKARYTERGIGMCVDCWTEFEQNKESFRRFYSPFKLIERTLKYRRSIVRSNNKHGESAVFTRDPKF